MLETLIDDRRFRIAGAIAGAVMLLLTAGFLIAAKRELTTPSLESLLPAPAYKIPILRELPEPQPMAPRRQLAQRADAGPRPVLLASTRGARRR